jgi:hypothetical protein
MTSEPDSTPGRRPPTIELKATEVGAEKPADAPEPGMGGGVADDSAETATSPGQPAGGPSAGGGRGGLLTTALAGIAAAAIGAFVIGAGLWYFGYIPLHQAPAPSAQAPTDSVVSEISAELKKIEGAIAAQRPAPTQPPAQTQQPDPALVSRIAAVEAQTKSLGDQLAALNRRVDDVAGAAQGALTQAKSAAAAAQNGVTRADLDALSARIAALDSAVKKLADDVTHQPRSANDRAARLTAVTEALRAAVERGAPYGAELAAAKSFGADQNATAALEPFAAAGVPSAAALARELAALIPALQHAVEPAANDGSFLGRLETNAQHLVRITPVDAPVGDDPASVVTRINVDAARADIAAALTDIAKLPEAAKPVTAAWVQKAQARDAAVAASRKLAADALAALDKPNSQ